MSDLASTVALLLLLALMTLWAGPAMPAPGGLPAPVCCPASSVSDARRPVPTTDERRLVADQRLSVAKSDLALSSLAHEGPTATVAGSKDMALTADSSQELANRPNPGAELPTAFPCRLLKERAQWWIPPGPALRVS